MNPLAFITTTFCATSACSDTWPTRNQRVKAIALVTAVAFMVATARAETEKADQQIDFETQVLPILKQNCLACHNASTAESDLVLETREDILREGDLGPAVLAGKSEESLLYQVVAGIEEPAMPPEDNDVGAQPLTVEQQQLLKLWIDQGARPGKGPKSASIAWQPVVSDRLPVLAAALSPHGRYLAYGRGTQLTIHHVPTSKRIQTPTDSQINERWQFPPAAHLDVIQSVAFSPDGKWIATGGFRTVKLWRRGFGTSAWYPEHVQTEPAAAFTHWASAGDGQHYAITGTGQLLVFPRDAPSPKLTETLAGGAANLASHIPQTHFLVVAHTDHSLAVYDLRNGAQITVARPTIEITALHTRITDDAIQLTAGRPDGNVSVWSLPKDLTSTTAPANEWQAAATHQAHDGAVTQLTFASAVDKDGGLHGLATGGADGRVRLWDKNSKEVASWELKSPITALAWVPDPPMVLAGTESGLLRAWSRIKPESMFDRTHSAARAARITTAKRRAALAKQQAENASSDKTKAEGRIKAEDSSIKAAKGEVSKAEDELKKKTEAVAKAKTAHQEAKQKHDAAQKAYSKLKTEGEPRGEGPAANEQNQPAQTKTKPDENAIKESEEALAAAKKLAEELKKKLDALAKQLKDTTSSRESAERELESSKGLLQRNQQNRELAGKVLKDRKATLEQANVAAAAAEKDHADAQAEPNASTDAIVGLVPVSDAQCFVVLRRGGAVEVRDRADGSLWAARALNGQARYLAGLQGEKIMLLDRQGRAIAAPLWPQWQLAQRIGDPDDPTILADRIVSLDFSPDSKTIAVGGGEPSRSGQLSIWQVENGELVRNWPDAHSDTVFGVQFAPDGNTIATASADRFAKTFDVKSGTLKRAYEGHTHYVQDVCWRADGRLMATAGADKAVKIWDPITAEQRKTLSNYKKEVTAVRFMGLEDRLAVSSGDGQVATILSNGKENKVFDGAKSFLHALDASRDGNLIVAAGEDRVVRIWSKDGKLMASLEPDPVSGSRNN